MGLDNNDYRDFLMHYGVKGMRWGKRKRIRYNPVGAGTIQPYNNNKDIKGVFIRTENYRKNGMNNKMAGHKAGVEYTKYGGNKKVSLYSTLGKRYEDKYWNNEEKYNRRTKTGGVLEKQWAEDGVRYSLNLTVAKKKVSAVSNKVKAKGQSFISRVAGKRLRRKR